MEKTGGGIWEKGQTDAVSLAVLHLSRESHGCSTSRVRERAGLGAFCSTHLATLCPSGSMSWQWTCSFYFCPRTQVLQRQLTLFQPSPNPCGAGKAPRRVPHPPRPAAAPLKSSTFSFSLLFFFFSHVDFTYHPHTHPEPHSIL